MPEKPSRPTVPPHLEPYLLRAVEALKGSRGWRRLAVPHLCGSEDPESPPRAVRWTIAWAAQQADIDLLKRELRGMAKTFPFGSNLHPYGLPGGFNVVHDEIPVIMPDGGQSEGHAAFVESLRFFAKYGRNGIGSQAFPVPNLTEVQAMADLVERHTLRSHQEKIVLNWLGRDPVQGMLSGGHRSITGRLSRHEPKIQILRPERPPEESLPYEPIFPHMDYADLELRIFAKLPPAEQAMHEAWIPEFERAIAPAIRRTVLTKQTFTSTVIEAALAEPDPGYTVLGGLWFDTTEAEILQSAVEDPVRRAELVAKAKALNPAPGTFWYTFLLDMGLLPAPEPEEDGVRRARRILIAAHEEVARLAAARGLYLPPPAAMFTDDDGDAVFRWGPPVEPGTDEVERFTIRVTFEGGGWWTGRDPETGRVVEGGCPPELMDTATNEGHAAIAILAHMEQVKLVTPAATEGQ